MQIATKSYPRKTVKIVNTVATKCKNFNAVTHQIRFRPELYANLAGELPKAPQLDLRGP